MAIFFILNWSYAKTIDDLVFRLKSIELSLFGIMIKMDNLIELMKISWGGGVNEDSPQKIAWRPSYFLIHIACRIIIKAHVCSKISFLKIQFILLFWKKYAINSSR